MEKPRKYWAWPPGDLSASQPTYAMPGVPPATSVLRQLRRLTTRPSPNGSWDADAPQGKSPNHAADRSFAARLNQSPNNEHGELAARLGTVGSFATDELLGLHWVSMLRMVRLLVDAAYRPKGQTSYPI